MTPSFAIKTIAACAILAGATASFAHVTLPPGAVTTGSEYRAAFRVGHACKDATATTGISVELPRGFELTGAEPRAGWTLAKRAKVAKNGPLGYGGSVSWSATTPAANLPGASKAEFVLRGRVVAAAPATLYFKVRQNCDTGSADWAQLPIAGASAAGTPGAKLAFPAPSLRVVAAGVATVDLRDAWVRPTVPGQSGTGAFMKLTSPTGARLVGVSSPVAGVAEVHEMKLDGDVMRMRAVKGGLDLPAGQMVELKPSGYHVMMMDLKEPMPKGATVPMTLTFEDAKGARTKLETTLTVGIPEGAPTSDHMH